MDAIRCAILLPKGTPPMTGASLLANRAPQHLGGGTGTARNLATAMALAAMARATTGD